MAGFTNRGKYLINGWVFRGVALPTYYYVALVTSATAPNADTNTLGQLTEIAAGNGYNTGGYQLSKNASDFDALTEDDTGDLSLVQAKDVTWNASGGSIPASGNGARYAVLTDDNGTIANRQVIAFWDLLSDRTVSTGQPLTLQNLELQLAEA